MLLALSRLRACVRVTACVCFVYLFNLKDRTRHTRQTQTLARRSYSSANRMPNQSSRPLFVINKKYSSLSRLPPVFPLGVLATEPPDTSGPRHRGNHSVDHCPMMVIPQNS
uniref:Putative secreted protein n=1 Tax=Anopheles triannulatus TaxID=58253 RepID=A0A2M4B5T3_9DIPT